MGEENQFGKEIVQVITNKQEMEVKRGIQEKKNILNSRSISLFVFE